MVGGLFLDDSHTDTSSSTIIFIDTITSNIVITREAIHLITPSSNQVQIHVECESAPVDTAKQFFANYSTFLFISFSLSKSEQCLDDNSIFSIACPSAAANTSILLEFKHYHTLTHCSSFTWWQSLFLPVATTFLYHDTSWTQPIWIELNNIKTKRNKTKRN